MENINNLEIPDIDEMRKERTREEELLRRLNIARQKNAEKNRRLAISLLANHIMGIICIILVVVNLCSFRQQTAVVTALNNQIDMMTAQIDELRTAANQVVTMSKDMEQLRNDNVSLASDYDSLKESYDTLSDRSELYDKYEYALFYNGERTELSYDMCSYGEILMEEYGLDPDLLFSIGMVESKYDLEAKNPTSSATGAHQFLQGTGAYVYNDLLGYEDTYVHSKMATDGMLSIEMAACYLDHLNNFNSNYTGIISGYTGQPEPYGYMNSMDSYLCKKGKSIYTMGP